MKHHGEKPYQFKFLDIKQILKMKNALDDCLSFNCQLGILQEESLRDGVSRSGWPSDKTMKNSISIAGLR